MNLHSSVSLTPAPSAVDEGEALLWVALVVGVALALVPSTYRWGRHGVTAVHEAGHALVALLAGRRLRSIRLNRDSSGETVSVGRSGGPGVVLTLLAGYPAPSLVGLSGVWAARHDHVEAWVLVLLVVLGGTLFLLRNVFGVVVMLAVLAGLVALRRWAEPEQALAACALVSAFLLAAGLRGPLELFASRVGANDASALARATHLPAALWKTAFVAVALAAAVAGAWVLGLQWPAASG